MATKTFSVDFEGYWREPNISGVPSKSGVYCVYACTYNSAAKTVSLGKLIYIGEAGNVNERVAEHEKWPTWKKHLKSGQEICVSFGYVQSSDRDRVEAALIFKHKPPVNEEYKNSFPFDTTTINTSGRNALLSESFTVYRKE